MDIIIEGNCVFHVDHEKTAEYYANLSLCTCPACRNLHAQIKESFPRLTAYLQQFSVDCTKPDEVSWIEHNHEMHYLAVYYTVTGTMPQVKKHKIDFEDTLPLTITFDEGYVPNSQTSDYFLITVSGIELPWVLLDEPLSESLSEPKNWLDKLKKKVPFFRK